MFRKGKMLWGDGQYSADVQYEITFGGDKREGTLTPIGTPPHVPSVTESIFLRFNEGDTAKFVVTSHYGNRFIVEEFRVSQA